MKPIAINSRIRLTATLISSMGIEANFETSMGNTNKLLIDLENPSHNINKTKAAIAMAGLLNNRPVVNDESLQKLLDKDIDDLVSAIWDAGISFFIDNDGIPREVTIRIGDERKNVTISLNVEKINY